MKLYGYPMSCSFAPHVALLAAELPFDLVWVSLPSAILPDGTEYRVVNPRRQVPALDVGDGQVLTETPAILQYIADLAPETGLAPAIGTLPRYRLQEALNYFSAECHKQVLWSLSNLDKFPGDRAANREFYLGLLKTRLDFIVERLAGQKFFLGERFTVADALLEVVLHWSTRNGVTLDAWPALIAYQERLYEIPAVGQAARINNAERARLSAAGIPA